MSFSQAYVERLKQRNRALSLGSGWCLGKMRQEWMTWQFPDSNRKWFINPDHCSPTPSMPCKLPFLVSGDKKLSVCVWMNSNPALTLLNIALGFRVVSSTKSRMCIRSLKFWSSLQKVSCLVWAETTESTQYSETALWVNANFGGVGFIYLYKYFTCRWDSWLMHWPLPFLCFPCHIHTPLLDLVWHSKNQKYLRLEDWKTDTFWSSILSVLVFQSPYSL